MPREMSNRGRVSVIAGISKGTLPPTGALSSLKPQSDPHLDLSAQPRAVSMSSYNYSLRRINLVTIAQWLHIDSWLVHKWFGM